MKEERLLRKVTSIVGESPCYRCKNFIGLHLMCQHCEKAETYKKIFNEVYMSKKLSSGSVLKKVYKLFIKYKI